MINRRTVLAWVATTPFWPSGALARDGGGRDVRDSRRGRTTDHGPLGGIDAGFVDSPFDGGGDRTSGIDPSRDRSASRRSGPTGGGGW